MSSKTNFKTYEASTRLLAAVIATNQGKIKLDFKDIATHIGGGTGKDAINHRLRPIKALAKMMSEYVAQDRDPGEIPLPGGKGGEIQKLFGESTASGIEWQFREIKHLGKAQQAALDANENPADVQPAGHGTPSRVKAPTASSRSGKSTKTPGGTGGAKRKRGAAAAKKRVGMSEEETSVVDDSDYDAKDVQSEDKDDDVPDYDITPTPKRRATVGRGKMPAATAQSATAKKNGKPSGSNGVRRSLFGDGAKPATARNSDGFEFVDLSEDTPERKPARKPLPQPSRVKAEPEVDEAEMDEDILTSMKNNGNDPFIGSDGMYGDEDDGLIDDEI